MIFADRTLSQKLERTEARSNADFVETRARLDPGHGAEWMQIAGVYAMYDGAESPLTQTFGLGVFDDITDDVMAEIEEFFKKRDAPVLHEVSPMADPSVLELLNRRGYEPFELTTVMIMSLTDSGQHDLAGNPRIVSRVIRRDEVDLWARTAAAGWSTEMPGMEEFMFNFSRMGAQCSGAYPYIAELDGKPIATAAFLMYEGVAILAGASTIPDARNQGGQTALLNARLQFARESGCTLAMMGAAPGSQSQINGQKNGFDIAYTRTKWQLK
ncbi:MAG: GNAT family N-acetyltransferase [Pyrinomonadaceae bacterium]